jgi:predicted regulator of Ras-like GTPase activity (Roadblock/LC7/MglB family)
LVEDPAINGLIGRKMDAKQALADLTEISSQIRSAVLLSDDGTIAGSTLDDEQAERMAKAAQALLEAAERTRPGSGPRALSQLEASTLGGSVFVVRDHGRVIAATTSPEPTVGLVFYDLKSCLRNASEGGEKAQKPQASRARGPAKPAEKESPPKPARRRTTKKKDDGAA